MSVGRDVSALMYAVAGMAVWTQPWDLVVGIGIVMETYFVHGAFSSGLAGDLRTGEFQASVVRNQAPFPVTPVVPAAWMCDSSHQTQGHLPSPRWAMDTLVFDAMDTPSFRGLVEVSEDSRS